MTQLTRLLIHKDSFNNSKFERDVSYSLVTHNDLLPKYLIFNKQTSLISAH